MSHGPFTHGIGTFHNCNTVVSTFALDIDFLTKNIGPVIENWDNMRFLLALYRHRTMSAAAMALNTNVATVSRRVERASQLYGVPLFVKEANGWAPTEAALPLLRVAEEFDARLTAERNSRATYNREGMDALVQIAAPPFFNTMVLVPAIDDLLTANPRMRLDVRNRSEATGLGDADILLRSGRPESGRVVARRICSMTFRAYRSTRAAERRPGWIAVDYRTASSPQSLLGREVFGSDPAISVALFEQKLTLMRSTGMGAVLEDNVAAQLGDMTPVDPAGKSVSSEMWMAYHATRRDDPAIKVVADWIVGCFRGGRFGLPRDSDRNPVAVAG